MNTHALNTDLYQLTMLASYFHRDMHNAPAICEMFVRRLPKNRRFLVAAGLEQVLDYLANLRFTDAQIESLRQVPDLRKAMTPEFEQYLRSFHFTGNVWAVPEGTVFFEKEPVIRVEAPLGEAQLIETFLLSTVNFQTMIASKAARVVLAARNRPVLEFGSRRTHGDAAVSVARAAYIAGFAGSSNVEAFHRYDVPARGTMAHMYIMASEDEGEAFKSYSELYPQSTYLVDTYDTLSGVKKALETVGEGVSAVRLDSGNLAELSHAVRIHLEQVERTDVKIVLSSDLDEYELLRLNEEGTYDAAGVGTRLATSDDAPSLGGVYKLVQVKERPVAKFSEGKVTYPGPHQVYRFVDQQSGKFTNDIIGMSTGERSFPFLGSQELLIPVVEKGKVIHRETIHEMRGRTMEQLNKLPEELQVIERSDAHESFYKVEPSERLSGLLEATRKAQSK